jgi:asparagine synthase (glutamine-hydrolysing)
MCGICGVFNFATHERVDPALVTRMARTIAHRGPDDEGLHVDGDLGLGFRRLSIIDLAGGHQPMGDAEGSVWVVFNGEIYNFPELRQELEREGFVFRTNSDTEVIVHGYHRWGPDVLERLNGMFGLAVWDARRRRLMLARDRAGIKLVYYRLGGGRLLFGSEIRPILAADVERPDIDCVSLNLFLRYRYTPSPRTLFQGIQKLAPGTRLIVEAGHARIERWWNFRPEPFDPQPTDDAACEELLGLYQRAVKRQLISDVPLGLLLSGGLDSGLLLSLMKLYGTSWNTYTVGYGDSFRDDELNDAAATARILGAPNETITIDRATFEETLPAIVASLEEPIASSSVVPMYHVCRRARQDVKVALMGQGPDELFGGYLRHLGVRYGAYWRNLPGFCRAALKRLLALAPRSAALRRGLHALDVPDRLARYQQVFSILPGPAVDGLFRDGALPPAAGDAILDGWRDLEPLMDATDELGGLQFLEVRSALPDELLMYGDKLSMAHALEVRVPYLDHEIIEYVERLSATFKVRRGSRKWLHRRVCRAFLPREVVRRKKRGFAVNVVDDWFRASVTGMMDGTLRDHQSLMYRHFRPEAVEHLLAEHVDGYRDHHKILFSLVLFETWLRNGVAAQVAAAR